MAKLVVGPNGELMTPQQVAQRRRMAASLGSSAIDTSPVGHWSQALARGAQGLLGGIMLNQADEAESDGVGAARDQLLEMLRGSGQQPAPELAPVAEEDVVAMPSGDDAIVDALRGSPSTGGSMADRVRLGLLQRGIPDAVADGFIMNFQDESGLNPGINEISPTVPGSRGGFGLAQWTGPRRVGLETLARQRGVDPSDVDLQLDYLVSELQGPESRAARNIMAARSPGEAGAAIVNDFLRPAPEHRQSRSERYLSIGVPNVSGTSDFGAQMSGGAQRQSASPFGVSQPQQSGADLTQLASLLANPWAAEQYGPVIQGMLQQQMQQSDPLYQARLAAMQQRAQPEAPKPIEVGGVLVDSVTYRPLFDSRDNKQTSDIQNYEYYANAARQRGDNVMPFEQYNATLARAGTANNALVGGIPQGYQAVVDPVSGRITNLEVIPGGPAEVEASQLANKIESKEDQAKTWNTIVRQDIERALNIINNSTLPTTGFFGDLLANIGGTEARDLRETLNTIKANAGFDRLQAMRDASPTGGALGAISERELAYLQATIGSLEQSQGKEQIERNLRRIGKIYDNLLSGKRLYDGLEDAPREDDAPQQNSIPRVSGAAEYDALPPGAQFIDPSGKTRRKQ